MINQPPQKHIRVIGIAPSSRGFGYAVMEGNHLVDWGIKAAKGDKNARALSGIANLLELYEPVVIALEDATGKGSRRASRIRLLHKDIIALASTENIRATLFSRKELMNRFVSKAGTRHGVAKALTVRFPEELGHRLPGKRKAWMSEDSRMDIFTAVALAESAWRISAVSG